MIQQRIPILGHRYSLSGLAISQLLAYYFNWRRAVRSVELFESREQEQEKIGRAIESALDKANEI